MHCSSGSGRTSVDRSDLVAHNARSPHSANSIQRPSGRETRGAEVGRPRDVADKMDKVLPGNPSVKAAIDIAVHDLAAQEAGVPLHRYLGATRDRMVTDMTIGIMDTRSAIERAQRWVQAGFRALKLKVGRDSKSDLERVRAIRASVGPGIELRIDGNQGYAWSQALSFARAAKDQDISI